MSGDCVETLRGFVRAEYARTPERSTRECPVLKYEVGSFIQLKQTYFAGIQLLLIVFSERIKKFLIAAGRRSGILSITKQMHENVFRENTFLHDRQQQLSELMLPFGAMRGYPSASAAFVFIMYNAMCHLVQVGDQKTVRIQIDIDRDPGTIPGFTVKSPRRVRRGRERKKSKRWVRYNSWQ